MYLTHGIHLPSVYTSGDMDELQASIRKPQALFDLSNKISTDAANLSLHPHPHIPLCDTNLIVSTKHANI